MRRALLLCLVVACLCLSVRAQTAAPEPSLSKRTQPVAPEPNSSMEWFQRASDETSLRMPGSAPFHIKVTFHAFAGEEMLGAKQKSDFITGEGAYEETWLGGHQWRRGGTLGGDSTGDFSLVRLSKSMGSQRADYTDSYYFLPRGLLALINDAGLVTSWADYVAFAGKAVARSLAIKAGDRDLLTANISIEPPGQTDPAVFDLPGGAAEPGMTLRPLLYNDVRLPDLSESYSWMSRNLGPGPVYSLSGVMDRHGRNRELEVILAPSAKDAEIFINLLRGDHHKPATIDGSPCEFIMQWRML